jgi:hypothetical protein
MSYGQAFLRDFLELELDLRDFLLTPKPMSYGQADLREGDDLRRETFRETFRKTFRETFRETFRVFLALRRANDSFGILY